MANLLIVSGTLQGKGFDLADGTYTIGRGPENTLQISDDSISYHHGEIVVASGRVFVRDLGSTNGTMVNRNPIDPASNGAGIEVKNGDEILFGHVPTLLKISVPVEPVATPAPVPQPTAVVVPTPAPVPQPTAVVVPTPAPVSQSPTAPNRQIIHPTGGFGLGSPTPASAPVPGSGLAQVAPETLLGKSPQPMMSPKPAAPILTPSPTPSGPAPIAPSAPVALSPAVPVMAPPQAPPAAPVPPTVLLAPRTESAPAATAGTSSNPPTAPSSAPVSINFTPQLVVYSGPMKGKTFELKEGQYTIGRLDDNTIFIPDDSISSHHAELVILAGRYSLRDLDSTNGTRVNQGKLDPYSVETNNATALKDGDQILFGDVLVRLELTHLKSPPSQLAAAVAAAGRSTAPPAGQYPTPTRVRADQIGISKSLAPDQVSTGFQKKIQGKSKVSPIFYVLGVVLLLLGIGLYIIIKKASN